MFHIVRYATELIAKTFFPQMQSAAIHDLNIGKIKQLYNKTIFLNLHQIYYKRAS